MADAVYTMLSNASATGSAIDWPGGAGTFVVDRGTFSSATVALQASFDGGTTWLSVDQGGTTYVTFTAAGAGNFEIGQCKLRATVTGSPSGLYAQINGFV